MWTTSTLGPILCQPLASMLDRVFVDIATNWTPDGRVRIRKANSFADAFRDIATAFERFSNLRETAAGPSYFRPVPLCFVPLRFSENALDSAADRAAGFAHRIIPSRDCSAAVAVASANSVTGVADVGELVANINLLTSHAQQLLHSGNLGDIVLGHGLLRRAQSLCALLARVRQLRAQAYWRGMLC